MARHVKRFLEILIALACIAVCVHSFDVAILHPRFRLPKQDRAFLETRPSRERVLTYFGHEKCGEHLRAGEKFKMTGWFPLPERAASHSAFAVLRPNGEMIHLFFGLEGEMEEFVISSS
jgi:hypothetical protein